MSYEKDIWDCLSVSRAKKGQKWKTSQLAREPWTRLLNPERKNPLFASMSNGFLHLCYLRIIDDFISIDSLQIQNKEIEENIPSFVQQRKKLDTENKSIKENIVKNKLSFYLRDAARSLKTVRVIFQRFLLFTSVGRWEIKIVDVVCCYHFWAYSSAKTASKIPCLY